MKKLNCILFFVGALLVLTTACGKFDPAEENASEVTGTGYSQTGMASYYGVGDGFHGRTTANGERFNAYGLTAAHRTLRFGTCLLVTNLYNGKKTVVRVNDRGPYSGGRILDLSYGAAKAVGMLSSGTAQVRIEGTSCSTTANTASNNEAATGANTTPVTDNARCKLFLSVQPAEENQLSFTVQSRVQDSERPCGKVIKILGSGGAAQGKEIASLDMSAGDGRKTIKLNVSVLEGVSHLHAQAMSAQGTSMGESEAKNLQLITDL